MARPVNDADGSLPDPSTDPVDMVAMNGVLTSNVDGSVLEHAEEIHESTKGRHAAPVTTRTRGRRRWAMEIAIVLIVAIGLAFVVRAFIVSPISVTTNAMADTVVAGDRLLVAEWTSVPQRGEVISFDVPDEWSPVDPDARVGWAERLRDAAAYVGIAAPRESTDMVLRVIAVGGQRIACCTQAGQLELEGVPLLEPYLRPGVPTNQITFDVVVPEGRFFVLGDDRALAQDSRSFLEFDNGTIPVEAVDGRVLLIAWPLDRFGPVAIETGSAG